MEEIKFVSRRGTSCKKWDKQTEMFSKDGLVGLWVADMDFKCADCILEAMHKYVDFGVFGYVYPWDSYFDAIIRWEKEKHGYEVKKEWICFAPGVVPGFNWVQNMLTEPGDGVMILTPSYYPMLEAPVKNGRKLVTSDLVLKDGRYVIDYEDFEKKIVDENVKAFIFGSPHNPMCRVWEKDELETLLAICRRHNVYVISDEIHQDITFNGHTHIPTATIPGYEDLVITVTAPSKTFNVAGLQNSCVIIPDDNLRAMYKKYTAGIRVLYGNTMGYVAAEAAFNGGQEWLDGVLAIIGGNAKYVHDRFAEEIPEVFVPELEGTYLQWLDFSRVLKPEQMEDFFENRCNLAMDYGNWFQGNPCCVRMNLATSRDVIAAALDVIFREYKNL